jgi:2,5-diamino-6-(ribosylamino)-4(3H)-pyrimidinone 5'-phosphate reductase
MPGTLPVTTLFMLTSVDGKISSGSGDERDFDLDLPTIKWPAQGLAQYYALEQKTDLTSFNTGKVMAKIGWNEEKIKTEKTPVSFVIVDNAPHLSKKGITNLANHAKKLYLVTNNANHPAFNIEVSNLEIIKIEKKINFIKLFENLKKKNIDNLTIQSGGEMNATLIRNGLINYVSIVMAPILVGGKETPTLIDGLDILSQTDLAQIKSLKVIKAEVLKNSYLHIKYEVIK